MAQPAMKCVNYRSSSDVRLRHVGGGHVGTERLADPTRVVGDQVPVATVVPVRRSTSAPQTGDTSS